MSMSMTTTVNHRYVYTVISVTLDIQKTDDLSDTNNSSDKTVNFNRIIMCAYTRIGYNTY